MIRAWLLLLVALAVGAAAAWLLRADAGYVLMNYGHYVIETSILGLFGSMILGLGVIVWGFRLLFAGVRLPSLIRRLLDNRREERARDTFEEGLLRLLEGNWKRAEIELVRRAADHHASHLNYLAAARAAQRLGAPDRRDHYLQLAASGDTEHDFAVLLTQTELQLERGEFAPARDTALRLHEQDPKHPYAVELLAQAFEGLADWEALRGLLIETVKLDALSAERREALMRRSMSELIVQAEAGSQLARMKALWDASGSELRRDPALRLRYAQALHRLNADNDAAALIGEALREDWDGQLVTLYGQLHGSDGVTRLASIEQWLSQYGERIELLITAGQSCLQNKLWGKARSYLEAAAHSQPSPAAYLELARLAEQTQNPDEAARYYRMGLELAA